MKKAMNAVVATRRSALALAQARAFASDLQRANPGLVVEELHVTTTGDRIQERALNQIGGKGLFIKEVEQALLDGMASFAVHSLKDVPAELAEGLTIACVPRRADARDVIVTRDGRRFADLAAGSRIGTSSLRRAVQLLERRPDLQIVPVRGNVDTRLHRCREGHVDAVVLARAGLLRLGLEPDATEILTPEICLPAIGQGALAIECRANDDQMVSLLARADDDETRIAVSAERGVMIAAQGSCQVPIAAYAQRDGMELILRALLADGDGTNVRRGQRRVAWPKDAGAAETVGLDLGGELRAR